MLARHMGKNTQLGRTSPLGIRFISQIVGSHPGVGTALGTTRLFRDLGILKAHGALEVIASNLSLRR